MKRLNLVIICILSSYLLLSCAESDNDVAPHTGSPVIENETAESFEEEPTEEEIDPMAEDDDEIVLVPIDSPIKESGPEAGVEEPDEPVVKDPKTKKKNKASVYYVSGQELNVRSSKDFKIESNKLGKLGFNDRVQVVGEFKKKSMVEVKIISTRSSIKESDSYFVHSSYLASYQLPVKKRHKYFMLQNIASERLRIYKRQCLTGSCAHKLVLDVDMVAGENRDRKRSILGSYHISSWHKFYQRHDGHYPSWYHPDYPMPPKPSAGFLAWTKKKYFPGGKKAGVRGAFGWYTAKLKPHAAAQWTHGTVGWGESKDKFIKMTRNWWTNRVSDPRSSGCSRLDNESIAFVRELLSVGTPVIKVYAKEALADKELSRYSGSNKKLWKYSLTTHKSEKSGRKGVEARGHGARVLEHGEYVVNQRPTGERFSPRKNTSGKYGNVYGLKEELMRGYLLIDEGRVVNYKHPLSPLIKTGGYSDHKLPNFVIAPAKTKHTPFTKRVLRGQKKLAKSK